VIPSTFVDHVYRWGAFEEVTVHEGVIVLWTEPGAGALVPRSAFANPGAEAAFLRAVRGPMAAAKPRQARAQAQQPRFT
jgi:hypothetical protein